MKKLAPRLALIATVSLLLLWFVNRPSSPSNGSAKPLQPEGSESPIEEAIKSAPNLEDSVPGKPASRTLQPGDLEPKVSEAPGAAHLFGSVLLPDGTPAAGASLTLKGWVANEARGRGLVEPASWSDVTAQTGADGHFELRLDPPPAFAFGMEVHLDGYANESWSWYQLDPAATVDVGAVTLRPAGAIEGRVLDAAGLPLLHPWRVFAYPDPPESPGPSHQPTQVSGLVDSSKGLFRLEGVAAGWAELSAHSQVAGWIEGPRVEVPPNAVVHQDLEYLGPDPDRRIEVVVFTRPFGGLSSQIEHVRLEGAGLDQTTKLRPGSSQSYSFDDLEPGPYAITIIDARFEPWSQAGVLPGEPIKARLVPSARLQLHLTDAATGKPLETASLWVDYQVPGVSGKSVADIASPGTLPAGDATYRVPPGDLTLHVRSPGLGEASLPVLGITPGETRAVSLALNHEAAIEGVVRDAMGRPAAGIQVLLMPAGAPPAPMKTWSGGSPNYIGALQQVLTYGEGKFQFTALEAGTFDVHAILSPWLTAAALGLVLAEGQRLETNLQLPSGALLDVSFTDLTEPLPDDFKLIVRTQAAPIADSPSPTWGDSIEGQDTFLERTPAGHFTSSFLPAGPAELLFGRPMVQLGNGSTPGTLMTLRSIELEAGKRLDLELNLGTRAPGAVLADVSLNGEPFSGAAILVRTADGQRAGSATTGTEGRARITGVLPGDYVIDLHASDTLVLVGPGSFGVIAGTTTDAHLEFNLTEGELTFLLPSGKPVASAWIPLQSEAVFASAETGAEGQAKLELPAGDYDVDFWTQDAESGASVRLRGHFTWPPAPWAALEVQLAP